jgi:hypothetical protein
MPPSRNSISKALLAKRKTHPHRRGVHWWRINNAVNSTVLGAVAFEEGVFLAPSV